MPKVYYTEVQCNIVRSLEKCLPGPLLLLGSGTASRVCARSRVAGRASLQRPALTALGLDFARSARRSALLPLFPPPSSFSPLSPEFLYLTLELAPGIHGLGVVGLALVRPGHPSFGPYGGFVHSAVGFSQGVAPAFAPWLRVGLVVRSLRVLDLVSYPWRL